MNKRAYFHNAHLPYLLVAPQIVITLIFFLWPAGSAMEQSFLRGDAFGIHTHFSGLSNFLALLTDGQYLYAIWMSLLFALAVTLLTMGAGLFMAVLVNTISIGKQWYKILLIWPYAVAPAVAGILWRFLFNPAVGIMTYVMQSFGYQWNYSVHPGQALLLVILAASWQQFSYNFLFYLTGLQSVPKNLLEASAIDGANSWQRFWHIVFPLLSPTTFFLFVINIIYAFFDTFGVIQVVTQGGPANATNILVYKVYNDGFVGLDLGGSAAQSVLLMLIIVGLTVVQFRYLERKVHY